MFKLSFLRLQQHASELFSEDPCRVARISIEVVHQRNVVYAVKSVESKHSRTCCAQVVTCSHRLSLPPHPAMRNFEMRLETFFGLTGHFKKFSSPFLFSFKFSSNTTVRSRTQTSCARKENRRLIHEKVIGSLFWALLIACNLSSALRRILILS